MLLISLFILCYCNIPITAVPFLPDLSPSIDQNWKPQGWRQSQYNWSGLCVSGHVQSPVDLVLGDAEVTYNGELQFNYESTGPISVDIRKRSGKVKGFPKWDKPPFFIGSNSSEKYLLSQFHFHLNSEHTFNGLHYPLELHLVHYREGSESKKGHLHSAVSVVAVPFLIAEKELDGIENLLTAASENRSSEPVPLFSPSVLLPKDRTTYFTYTGSLTSPPCTEGVTWIVFPEPKLISAKQLESLVGSVERPFVGAARPLQSRNGRKLYMNKSGRALSNNGTSPGFLGVIVIVLLCVGLLLVLSLLILWVMRKKSKR